MSRHRLVPVVAIVAATLTLSGCGWVSGSTATPPPAAAPAAPAATGGPQLTARQQPGVGTVVTDTDGYTLYRFDKDKAKPPASTCVDACAVKWPPVTVDPKGKLTLDGVDKAAIGLVARPDGSTQLTLGGWPVYRYSGDAAPGAAAGQGLSGTWFAVAPDGKKAVGTGGSGAAGTGGAAKPGTATGGTPSGATGGAASGGTAGASAVGGY